MITVPGTGCSPLLPRGTQVGGNMERTFQGVQILRKVLAKDIHTTTQAQQPRCLLHMNLKNKTSPTREGTGNVEQTTK